MKSGLFKLNRHDLIKGIYLALIVAVLTSVYQMASAQAFSWGELGYALLSSVASYLIKNLITNSDDKVLRKDEV